MNETITTAAELDALPIGSVVTDAFAATCIRARVGSGNSLFDWVRVTGAVKNGEHHHPPYLPADVERRGWSGWTSTPDVEPAPDRLDVQTAMAYGLGVEDGQREPARTEPTEEQIAETPRLRSARTADDMVSPRRYTRAEHEAAKRLGLSDEKHRGAIWWATGPYWPSEVAAMADRARQTIADCELLGQAMAREWEVL